MSFFKKIFKKVHHFLDPINPLFKDKKKSAPPGEKPYDWQAELDRVQKEYGGVDAETRAGEEAMSRTSGTYSDSPQFQQSLKAESDAASRLRKYQLQQRANEARKNLGLPESPAGSM